MVTAITAIKGVKFIPFLFKYWYVWLTLVFILPTIIHSIQDSNEQEDWSIAVKQIGGLFASSDNELYKAFETFEFEKESPISTADKINYYSSLFWSIGSMAFLPIWMMFFMFIALYKIILFLSGNDSAKLGAAIITILIIVVLQAVIGKIPFKGLFSMAKTTWGLM